MKAATSHIEKANETYALFNLNGKTMLAQNLLAGHYFIVDMGCYAVHNEGYLCFEDGSKTKAFRTFSGVWNICRKKYDEANRRTR